MGEVEQQLSESVDKLGDGDRRIQTTRALDEFVEKVIGKGYEGEIQDPLRTGLKLSAGFLGGVAAAAVAVVLTAGVRTNRWVWAAFALVAAFGVAVCFGYTYTARRIGVRRARNIFYIALAIGLIGFVYAMMRLIPRL